jgi:hypothetical protein
MSHLRKPRRGRKPRSSRSFRTKLGLETLEPRTLLSTLLGEGGRRVVQFHDSVGDLVSLRLWGPGSAVVTLQGNAARNADLQSLVLQRTDGRSRLTVRMQGAASAPRLTGSIDVAPGGLGDLVVRGTLSASVFSQGRLQSIEASAVRGAVIESTSGIGRLRVSGRVEKSTILAGLDMVGGVPGNGDGVPGAGTIGRVEIGTRLLDTTIAAGVAPGLDGRFGTADDIPATGPAASTIGPVMVGGRIAAGYGPGAAVVIVAADRTPLVYEQRGRFAGAAGVSVLGPIAPPSSAPPGAVGPTASPPSAPPGTGGPIAPPPSTPPAAPDPIDRKQLVNVSSSTSVHYSGIFNDRRTHRSTVNVQVTNTSATPIPTPLILVIESISDPSVTVANADGIVTPDGHSFFDLTGQVPGSTLQPGATTSNRPLVFNNPLLRPFTITTSVNHEITNPPAPNITLSLPADPQGRRLIGIADAPALPGLPNGMVLTVSASGTAPVTVNLGQSAAGIGSRGGVFFGDTGTATTAAVTTSGGTNNVASIRVRGDSAHPSAYQGDLNLTASVGGTPAATAQVTVFRLAIDTIDATLLNDAEVVRTLTTTPAISGLDIAFQFDRGTVVGNQIAPPYVETPSAINVIPLSGPTVQTGADGTARFELQQGVGGQGLTGTIALANYSNGVSTGATAEDTTTSGDFL